MSDINITVNDEIVNIDVIDTPVLVEVTNSPGPAGPAGVGVPVGGTTGQVLAKNSSTNYDTVWVNPSGGGVPYSGATGNVNLGEYELKAGQVTLDTTPTGTAAVGTTRWNDNTGTSETTLKGGSVVLKNGVDLVARVVNKVSPNTTLTKAAYQAVRISGAQGQRLAVALAQANNDTNSADTIGLVTETIATNQEGFIMTMGQLENINTTGTLQGETWVDGDVLYLSPTTAGALTNIKPTGAGHIVVIGYVEYAHVNNGKIYTKVMNGWELDELHDVDIISPANNEALIYESSTSLWKNKTIATALGYTPANAATTLTINGVTYDLSTSRTWTIAAGISGSGASGQVTYWTGASAVSGSNNLFWDNTNGRLGIGTNAPAYDFDLRKSSGATAFGAVGVAITNTSGTGEAYFVVRNQSFYAGLEVYGDNFGTAGLRNTALFTTQVGLTYFGFATLGNAPIGFRTNTTSGTTNERLTILGNGNVAVNSTSDLGVRFGVIGDTLLRGSGATSATTALTVQNSSSTNLFTVRNDVRVGIATNAPTAALDIWNATDNAQLRISDSRVSIPNYSGVGFSPVMGTNTLGFLAPWSSSTGGVQFSGFTSNTNTGTPFAFVGIHGGTSPTTPALRLRGWKHNGTTGLAVLTGTEIIAGFNTGNNADVFQVKANGTINMSSLPTSSTGLVAGDLWNNGGVINIV